MGTQTNAIGAGAPKLARTHEAQQVHHHIHQRIHRHQHHQGSEPPSRPRPEGACIFCESPGGCVALECVHAIHPATHASILLESVQPGARRHSTRTAAWRGSVRRRLDGANNEGARTAVPRPAVSSVLRREQRPRLPVRAALLLLLLLLLLSPPSSRRLCGRSAQAAAPLQPPHYLCRCGSPTISTLHDAPDVVFVVFVSTRFTGASQGPPRTLTTCTKRSCYDI